RDRSPERADRRRARVSPHGVRGAVGGRGAPGRCGHLCLGRRGARFRRARLDPAPAAGSRGRDRLSVPRSTALFDAAQRVIPGGVNRPVRAFRAVGGTPFFVARAEGARIIDVDGRSYLDFLGSWGPLILGHAAGAIVEAVADAARRGTSYGAPTEGEVEMAQMISRAVPSMEMVRLVSAGGGAPGGGAPPAPRGGGRGAVNTVG